MVSSGTHTPLCNWSHCPKSRSSWAFFRSSLKGTEPTEPHREHAVAMMAVVTTSSILVTGQALCQMLHVTYCI